MNPPLFCIYPQRAGRPLPPEGKTTGQILGLPQEWPSLSVESGLETLQHVDPEFYPYAQSSLGSPFIASPDFQTPTTKGLLPIQAL